MHLKQKQIKISTVLFASKGLSWLKWNHDFSKKIICIDFDMMLQFRWTEGHWTHLRISPNDESKNQEALKNR